MQRKKQFQMKLALTVMILLAFNQVSGQTEKNHQIDIELQYCLDSTENSTTTGMTTCMVKATQKWDKELNKNYDDLLSLLTQEQKEKFRIAQKKWMKYRDTEIEFSNQLYYDMQGTMWMIVAAEKKLELTKKRAIELLDYSESLTIEN